MNRIQFLTLSTIAAVGIAGHAAPRTSFDPGHVVTEKKSAQVLASDVICDEHNGSGGYDISYSTHQVSLQSPFMASNALKTSLYLSGCVQNAVVPQVTVPTYKTTQTLFVRPDATESEYPYRQRGVKCIKKTLEILQVEQRPLIQALGASISTQFPALYAYSEAATVRLEQADDRDCETTFQATYDDLGHVATCTGVRHLTGDASNTHYATVNLYEVNCHFEGPSPIPDSGLSYPQTLAFLQTAADGKSSIIHCSADTEDYSSTPTLACSY